MGGARATTRETDSSKSCPGAGGRTGQGWWSSHILRSQRSSNQQTPTATRPPITAAPIILTTSAPQIPMLGSRFTLTAADIGITMPTASPIANGRRHRPGAAGFIGFWSMVQSRRSGVREGDTLYSQPTPSRSAHLRCCDRVLPIANDARIAIILLNPVASAPTQKRIDERSTR